MLIQGMPMSSIQSFDLLDTSNCIDGILDKIVVLKLTKSETKSSIGLSESKAMIAEEDIILDMQVQQINNLNERYGCDIPLVLMDALSVKEDSQSILRRYNHLNVKIHCFQQNKRLSPCLIPKIESQGKLASYYPPGYQDLYIAFYTSNLLKKFVADGKEFLFISNLDMKMKKHLGKSLASDSDTCNTHEQHPYTFLDLKNVKVETVVGNIKTEDDLVHRCQLCGKGFDEKWDLDFHLHSHTGMRETIVQSDNTIIKEETILPTEKENNINTSNMVKKGKNVSICKRPVNTNSKLASGSRKYRCTECTKTFTQLFQLKIHEKFHTQGFHKCTHCDKQFRAYSDLVKHVRVHTGERPYGCSICGKGFAQHGGLIRHLRTHTGEKLFQCKHCHKSFTQGGYLKIHETKCKEKFGDNNAAENSSCKESHTKRQSKSQVEIHIAKKIQKRISTGEEYQMEIIPNVVTPVEAAFEDIHGQKSEKNPLGRKQRGRNSRK